MAPYQAYRSDTDCRPDKTREASHQAWCADCYKIEITLPACPSGIL